MSQAMDALVLDLLEWLAVRGRTHAEVMEAWRTSCPRLPVWEEANERGLITMRLEPGRGTIVSLSDAGRELLNNAEKEA